MHLIGFSFFGLRLCLSASKFEVRQKFEALDAAKVKLGKLEQPTHFQEQVGWKPDYYSYLASWGWLITTATFVFLYIKRAQALEMFIKC